MIENFQIGCYVVRQRECGNAIVRLARLRPIATQLDEFHRREFAGDPARALESIAIDKLSQSIRRPPEMQPEQSERQG